MTSEIRKGSEAVVEALDKLTASQDKVFERLDRHCEYLAQGLVDPDWSPELIRIMHHGTPPLEEDSDVEDELLRQEMEQVEQEMRELRHDRSSSGWVRASPAGQAHGGGPTGGPGRGDGRRTGRRRERRRTEEEEAEDGVGNGTEIGEAEKRSGEKEIKNVFCFVFVFVFFFLLM